MQDITKNCHYPELVAEALRLELKFTFLLECVTELIVLDERMSSIAPVVFGGISKRDNVLLQQTINRISQLEYRYFGSFPSHYVPTLDIDTFAIIITQPNNKQRPH